MGLLSGDIEVNVDGQWRKYREIQQSHSHNNLDRNEFRIHKDALSKISNEKNMEHSWNGERFEIRPLALHCDNLAKVTSNTQILTNVQIHRYSMVDKFKVHISDYSIDRAVLYDELSKNVSALQKLS